MTITIHQNAFKTEAEAAARIAAEGLWPMPYQSPANVNADHAHDFDALTFILEGEMTLTLSDTGETCVCGPGTLIDGKAGVMHRDHTEGYRALVGMSVDPATMKMTAAAEA